MTEKEFRTGTVVSLIKRLGTTTVLVCVLAFILSFLREVPIPGLREKFIQILNKVNMNMSDRITLPEDLRDSSDYDMEDPSIEMIKNGNSVSNRNERFPTVEKRVKLYMSNWYNPPCESNDKYQYPPNLGSSLCIPETAAYVLADRSVVKEIFSTVRLNRVFFVDEIEKLETCIDADMGNLSFNCEHIMELYKILLAITSTGTSAPPPLLLQFGDGSTSQTQGIVQIPHFAKIRPATFTKISAHEEIERVAVSCLDCIPRGYPRSPLNTGRKLNNQERIIWNMNADRFYSDLDSIADVDIEWSEKKNVAVFRGALTGCNRHSFSTKLRVYDPNNISSEDCMSIMRCRIVLKYGRSRLVDAKIVGAKFNSPYGRGTLPDVLDDVALVGNGMSYQEQLRYKVLIVLGGNDIASGLAWSLLSKSVVFMQAPKYTSWLMEELLEPWVHYIPIAKELTDLEEKMKWVMEHDTEARHIAERGTLWVYDLLFHDDADKDDELVKIEMAQRYMAHFQVNTSDSILCPEGTVEPEDDDDDDDE
eukprot:scaffold95132_cov59-Attheya_sp.AAC.1